MLNGDPTAKSSTGELTVDAASPVNGQASSGTLVASKMAACEGWQVGEYSEGILAEGIDAR
jgi:hypothetical protein